MTTGQIIYVRKAKIFSRISLVQTSPPFLSLVLTLTSISITIPAPAGEIKLKTKVMVGYNCVVIETTKPQYRNPKLK